MKSTRTLFAAFFILTSFFAHAQFEKGNVLIGINYELDVLDRPNYWFNAANLHGGYFFWDEITIGLEASFNSYDISNFESDSYQIGLIGRKYFGTKWERLWLYGGAELGYSKGNSIINDFNPDTEDEFESDVYIFGLETGVNYFVTEKLSLELNYETGWRRNYNSRDDQGRTNSFGDFHIGANFHF